MSAQKILITCLGLVSLMALGGCNDVKSPTFQPRTEFLELKVCEADSNGSCPVDGANCNARLPASPSLIPVNLSAQFCALGRYEEEQLQEDDGEFSAPTTSTWRNLSNEVVWSSENPQIASIDASGQATGVSEGGPITISAELEERMAETSLQVTEPALLDVAIAPNGAIELLEGADLNFACRGSFSGACDSSGSNTCDITQSADFSSDDSTRFSVDADGSGSALAATDPGQPVTVTCSDENNAQQPPQTVVSDPPAEITICGLDSVTSVEIMPDNLRLPVGDTQQLNLIANYTSCSSGDAQQIDVTTSATWSSSDDSIAPVDGNGVVTGLAEGQAEITGSFAGLDSAPLLVVVSDSVVDSLRVEGPAFAFATPGENTSLSYTAFAVLADADSGEIIGEEELNNAPDQPFASWSSSAPAISFADANIGVGTLDGDAVTQDVEITAEYLGLSASITTRIADVSVVKSMEITPSVACIADELSLGLLGDPVIDLTAHAIVELDGAAACSVPVTNLVDWGTSGADLTSAVLSNINIPVLGDILSDVVGMLLGECDETIPLTIGEAGLDFGVPFRVSNEPPKGQVSGDPDTINLAGGGCALATWEAANVAATASVLVATELELVCEPLLVMTEPSAAACAAGGGEVPSGDDNPIPLPF